MQYTMSMSSSRARNTTRQREAGAAAREETRRRLLVAAGEEFEERGYTRATVTRIAARAGVTVQTLYLAWGSKRALLRAFMEQALAGSPGPPAPEELPDAVAGRLKATTEDAYAVIQAIAGFYRQIGERAALGWQLYRDAAASDPEIAADWQELQRLRRGTFGRLIARLPPGSLRAGMSHDQAADTAWAIASPETWDLLIRRAGYSIDAYQGWVAETLTAALLEPAR